MKNYWDRIIWSNDSPALQELANSGTKNPIFVHYIRETTPGYHNRGHRKAISRAGSIILMCHITNIDPWDTPWIVQAPRESLLTRIHSWVADVLRGV